MAQLIDGKMISAQIKDELKEEVAQLKGQGITPCLAVIQVGNDPASSVYVNNKKKACAYIGIDSLSYELEETISQEKLLELISELNQNEKVNGILVQLPLPKHIDENAVIQAITPAKDVDGFHPETVGNMCIGTRGFRFTLVLIQIFHHFIYVKTLIVHKFSFTRNDFHRRTSKRYVLQAQQITRCVCNNFCFSHFHTSFNPKIVSNIFLSLIENWQ